MKKITHWHKLQIGKWQNRLRIDNYETMWLSWLKGIITGVILISLLSGCYIYGVPSTSYSQNTSYNDYDDLSYYKTYYVPTLDLYHWNNLPYWGYSDGWYYYYGYRHSYPWWYYYQYSPSYHYNIHTHVYCYLNTRTHVQRPRSHRRMDNKNNRTYNVTYVNQNGVSIKNNSNTPVKFQNKYPDRTTKVNVTPNRTTKVKSNNTFFNRSNEIYINRPNTKVKTNTRVKTNRTNTHRSNKTNNRRPR